jgi:hypothetical protein
VPTAANALAPPFTPSSTITVCPSGCAYTTLSAAIIGLSNANQALGTVTDNVEITMKAGTYEDCIQFGNNSPFTPPTNDRVWHLPQHLWIKGIGGDFARMEGMDNLNYLCQGKGLIVFWGNVSDTLYIDNLELADQSTAGPTAAFYPASGSAVLRNVNIHDGENGILSGESPATFTIQNSRFAREGGATGPQHNLYIGGGTTTFTLDHSISQQASWGHEAKSRAFVSIFNCDQMVGSQDPFYIDSENIDCPEGRDCRIQNNTLVKGPGSTQQNQIGWMMDHELGKPAGTWALTLTNNIIIYDGSDFHWAAFIGPPVNGSASQMTSPPSMWTNNVFVGGASPADLMTPYSTYHVVNTLGFPDPSQVTEIGDTYFQSRAAAGISQTIPPPPGCSGPIGNLAIP